MHQHAPAHSELYHADGASADCDSLDRLGAFERDPQRRRLRRRASALCSVDGSGIRSPAVGTTQLARARRQYVAKKDADFSGLWPRRS